MMVFDKEIVKARKDHKCTWCGEKILKGTSYHKWVNVDDSWFTNKVHDECLDALDKECRHGDGEYIPYDNERPTVKHEGV